ncbi:MAG: hypothetical protein V4754_02945 [Pseudomonadota bacterium]
MASPVRPGQRALLHAAQRKFLALMESAGRKVGALVRNAEQAEVANDFECGARPIAIDGMPQSPPADLFGGADADACADQARPHGWGAMPVAQLQALSRDFQTKLQQHGDPAAQAILALMNQPLAASYPLVLDGISAVIVCNLVTWKRPLLLANGQALSPAMGAAALAALLAQVDHYIGAARNAHRKCVW